MCMSEATQDSGQSRRWQEKREGHRSAFPVIIFPSEMLKKLKILSLNIADHYEGMFVKVGGQNMFYLSFYIAL